MIQNHNFAIPNPTIPNQDILGPFLGHFHPFLGQKYQKVNGFDLKTHIPLTDCPELKNIGLTLWVIRKTSFWFSRHVAIQTLDVMKHLSLHSLHLIGDKGTEGSRYLGFVFFPDRRGDHLVDKGSSVGHLEEGRRISPGFLIKNFGAVQESRF